MVTSTVTVTQQIIENNFETVGNHSCREGNGAGRFNNIFGGADLKNCFTGKEEKYTKLNLINTPIRLWASFWNRFEVVLELFWECFGIVLGTFWYRFGFVLGSYWDCFGIVLESFWDSFGIVLDSFDLFGVVLVSFWDSVAVVLLSFSVYFGIVLVSFRDRFGIVLESFWDRFEIVSELFWGRGGCQKACSQTRGHPYFGSLLEPKGSPIDTIGPIETEWGTLLINIRGYFRLRSTTALIVGGWYLTRPV